LFQVAIVQDLSEHLTWLVGSQVTRFVDRATVSCLRDLQAIGASEAMLT
jgi:hypothetical protein